MAHSTAFARTASKSLAGVSALAVLATLQTPQAAAQEGGYETIIVTARRASESLQDVPATVAVVTEATLLKVNATTVEDVIELVPGVSIVTNTAEVGDTQINIRGINGARDGESSVGLVVDGILKTNNGVLNSAQTNLTQIEILKGPQGAYYGRNAAAGAIVMTTRKPSDDLEVFADVSYGNNDTLTGAITAAGPIADGVGLLVSADYRSTDGFFRNTGPNESSFGATVDQYEGFNFQARLVADIGDDTELDVKARYGEVESGSINYNVTFQLPIAAAFLGVPSFNGDVNAQQFDYQSNYGTLGRQDTFELSAMITRDFDNYELKIWSLYSDVKQDLLSDGTVAAFGFFNETPECIASVADLNAQGVALQPPLFIGETPGGSTLGAYSPTTCDGTQYQVRNQEDISFELRFASSYGGDFEWSLGAYYLHIDRRVGVSFGYDRGQGILANLFNDQNTINPTEQLSDDTFDTDVIAVFGSADYEITDTLALSAALRWDREDRSVSNNVPEDAVNQFIGGGGQPLNIGLLDGPIEDQDAVFSQIQPRVSLAWTPTPELTAFASWGVGFKSGGFNNQGAAATIEANFNIPDIGAGLNLPDLFEKETSNAFEIGVKGTLFDNVLQYELAGYYTLIDDMQFFEFFVGGFGIQRIVSNIDEVEIMGIEGSVNVRVTDGVNIFGGFSINDSEIKENSARPGTEGGASPYTPDYTINAGLDWVEPLTDDLNAVFRLDYRRTGATWFHTVQEGDRPTLFNLPTLFGPAGTANFVNSERDAFSTINIRGGIEGDNWSVIAFAENLTNNEYLDEVIPAPEFGGSFTSPGARRYYGVQVRMNF